MIVIFIQFLRCLVGSVKNIGNLINLTFDFFYSVNGLKVSIKVGLRKAFRVWNDERLGMIVNAFVGEREWHDFE